MNPALLAYLAAVTGASAPGQSKFPVQPNGVDPLAPIADPAAQAQAAAPIAPPAPDSVNDGINSVGRPVDVAAGDAETKQKLDNDYAKRYKKELREGKGEALLALGAQLLSSRTFSEGLSKGLLAYQQTLSRTRDSLKPKIESVGNGTFERSIDPITGEATYTETPLADFQRKHDEALTQRQLDVQGLRNEGTMNVTQANIGSREKIADLQWNTRKDIANLQANTAKYGADLRSSTAIQVAKIAAANGGGRGNSRGTASLLKLATDHQATLNATTMAMQNLAPTLQDLKTGQLTLGLVKNAGRKVAMATGIGGDDPETQRYARMRQVVEQNRNAILMAAKGVQTEGDAQRALSQIMSSDANTATVTTQFEFLMDILKRSAENERGQLDLISNNSGLQLPDAHSNNQTSTGVSWQIVH